MNICSPGTSFLIMLEFALELAEKGYHVFPCKPGRKTPITPNGFKDATINKDKIREYWTKTPNANIGLATGKISGITVIDVDPRHGGDTSIELYDVPPTPYVKTGQGGRHYYFKYTPEAKPGNNVIAPGLDTKNDGGYCIAAPSILGDFPEYNLVNGGKYCACDEDEPLAQAPEWIKSNKFEEETKKFKIKSWPIPQGEQDSTLFRLACSLRHQDFTPGLIRETIKNITNDNEKCPQDPKKPFTEKDIERWIKMAFKYPENESKKKLDPIIFLNPISTSEFKKKDLPPIEFYLDGLLQKKGRLMISAKANKGKTFFLINMLTSICRGDTSFLNTFDCDGSKPNILYFELEMGESALQERLLTMGDNTSLDNLYVQCMYGWDMLNKEHQAAIEDIIKSKNINIIAFDPLGSLWSGDENKRESVKELTDYFDYLLDKYGVSVCITHHWRKSTKDFKEGGEMAAGSYGWTKWLDNHITIHGEVEEMIISCDKSRNREKWNQIKVNLNKDNLLLEFVGEFENKQKFNDDDMLVIFNSFGVNIVLLSDFIRKGKQVCSRTTLYRLLEDSKYLKVDKDRKPYYVSRKEQQMEWGE